MTTEPADRGGSRAGDAARRSPEAREPTAGAADAGTPRTRGPTPPVGRGRGRPAEAGRDGRGAAEGGATARAGRTRPRTADTADGDAARPTPRPSCPRPRPSWPRSGSCGSGSSGGRPRRRGRSQAGAKLSGKAADLLAAVRAVESGEKPAASRLRPSREPAPRRLRARSRCASRPRPCPAAGRRRAGAPAPEAVDAVRAVLAEGGAPEALAAAGRRGPRRGRRRRSCARIPGSCCGRRASGPSRPTGSRGRCSARSAARTTSGGAGRSRSGCWSRPPCRAHRAGGPGAARAALAQRGGARPRRGRAERPRRGRGPGLPGRAGRAGAPPAPRRRGRARRRTRRSGRSASSRPGAVRARRGEPRRRAGPAGQLRAQGGRFGRGLGAAAAPPLRRRADPRGRGATAWSCTPAARRPGPNRRRWPRPPGPSGCGRAPPPTPRTAAAASPRCCRWTTRHGRAAAARSGATRPSTVAGLLSGAEGPGRDADGALALDLLVVLDAPQLDVETAAMLVGVAARRGPAGAERGPRGAVVGGSRAGSSPICSPRASARRSPRGRRTPAPIGELVSGIGIGELNQVEAPGKEVVIVPVRDAGRGGAPHRAAGRGLGAAGASASRPSRPR